MHKVSRLRSWETELQTQERDNPGQTPYKIMLSLFGVERRPQASLLFSRQSYGLLEEMLSVVVGGISPVAWKWRTGSK